MSKSAVPLISGITPRTAPVLRSRKRTVPVGTLSPLELGNVTVAVKVTSWPWRERLLGDEETRAVAVAAAVTPSVMVISSAGLVAPPWEKTPLAVVAAPLLVVVNNHRLSAVLNTS